MRNAWLVILALLLCGCEAKFRFGQAEPVVAPPGDKITIQGDQEIIQPADPRAMCSARAAHFRGLVSVPCEDIARQIRP